MEGVTFDMSSGPMMKGTWTNPKTGDTFTVADSYFEDNQYMVRTTDGRLLTYDQIQNYVEGLKPAEINAIKNEQKPKQTPVQSLPKEVSDMIAGDDSLICDDDIMALGNIYNQGNLTTDIKPESSNQLHNKLGNINASTNINDAIIEKALGKIAPPKCNVTLFWDYFPEKEILALVDVMGVDVNDIIMWYVNKMDFETIANSIKNAMMTQVKLMDKNELYDSNNVQVKVLEEPEVKKSVKKNAKRKPVR